MKKVTYSILVPVYNEQDSLLPLWREISKAMTKIGSDWELIFINDGSTDKSLSTLRKIAKNNGRVRVVSLHHNQGKSVGLMAGFRSALGEIIITMDADLQDDPNEIPKFIAKLSEGYDLISGYKKSRHDPIHKTWPSRVFNALVRSFTGTKLHDVNCGFKVYRRVVADHLYLYGELYRFIPVLAATEGFTITEVVVNHRPRKFGQSKFGASRFIRGSFDLMTVVFRARFLKRPLHFFGGIGSVFLVIGIAVCAYLSYLHFFKHASISDRPLLLFGILLVIAGIQLLCTGLLAELITFYHQRNEIRLGSKANHRRASRDDNL